MKEVYAQGENSGFFLPCYNEIAIEALL